MKPECPKVLFLFLCRLSAGLYQRLKPAGSGLIRFYVVVPKQPRLAKFNRKPREDTVETPVGQIYYAQLIAFANYGKLFIPVIQPGMSRMDKFVKPTPSHPCGID